MNVGGRLKCMFVAHDYTVVHEERFENGDHAYVEVKSECTRCGDSIEQRLEAWKPEKTTIKCGHCGTEITDAVQYAYRGDKLCHDCYGSVRGLTEETPGWLSRVMCWIIDRQIPDSEKD